MKDKKIIISLTTHPGRIELVYKTIHSMFCQTESPDKILLWLSKEQFLNLELPDNLVKLQELGLEILFCEDLKPHKKYYYTMQRYPDDIIITIDDDVIYSPKLIECLMQSYYRHPGAISAARAHRVREENGEIAPYETWYKNYTKLCDTEEMDLVAIGCGGILYPPHCLDNGILFTKQLIMENCLFQDDLWLKLNELICGVPVVRIRENLHSLDVMEARETALYLTRNTTENDLALDNLNKLSLSMYGKRLSDYIFEKEEHDQYKFDFERKTWIYGAGKVAESLLQLVEGTPFYNCIRGIIVTSQDNRIELCGKSIFSLEDKKDEINASDQIIIATLKKSHEEICKILVAHGISRVVYWEDELMRSCMRAISDKKELCSRLLSDIQSDLLEK